MTTREAVANELEHIASSDDFAARSEDLTEAWRSQGMGVEAVEPILSFIEKHPSVDFGMPGALVHFVERFHGSGYEASLAESLRRRPTAQTIWMLNRVINGEKNTEKKEYFLDLMSQARVHKMADGATIARIDHFLRLHGTTA